MRFHVTQFTFVNFVRYHKPPCDIMDICSEIYFHSISFQTKELKEKINQFFNNFTLEEKDYFLLNE